MVWYVLSVKTEDVFLQTAAVIIGNCSSPTGNVPIVPIWNRAISCTRRMKARSVPRFVYLWYLPHLDRQRGEIVWAPLSLNTSHLLKQNVPKDCGSQLHRALRNCRVNALSCKLWALQLPSQHWNWKITGYFKRLIFTRHEAIFSFVYLILVRRCCFISVKLVCGASWHCFNKYCVK